MKILIIEDDEGQIRTYKRAFKHCDRVDEIECEFFKRSSDAIKELEVNEYDAAIVDLKLEGDSGTDNASGNEVLNHIFENSRYPVFVVSGNTSDLEEKFRGHPLIEPVNRGVEVDKDLLPKIFSRHDTGVTKVFGGKGHFEKALDKIFWSHLPYAMKHWEESESDPEVKEKQLLRYTISHLQELLGVNNDGREDVRDRAEIYIKPSVRDSAFNGCIVNNEGVRFLVMTPACSLAQSKSEFLLLVKIIPLKCLEKIRKKEKSNSRRTIIKNYIENKNQRYHFLPHFDNIEASVIDFEQLVSLTESDFREKYNIECSISPSFQKDIVNRFSTFYARQGSPDFDFESLSEDINNSL